MKVLKVGKVYVEDKLISLKGKVRRYYLNLGICKVPPDRYVGIGNLASALIVRRYRYLGRRVGTYVRRYVALSYVYYVCRLVRR